MTQRIRVAGPGFDYPTLSAAVASIPPGALIEPIVLEVHSSAPPEGIVISPLILPSLANPLIIYSFRSPPVVSPFSGITYVTGSLHDVPPPQPRHVKATMLSFEIFSNFTQVDGFRVTGNIVVQANNGVIVNGNLVENGQVQVIRSVPVAVSARISNNEIRKGTFRSGIILSKVSAVKLWHNTILQRRSEAIDLGLPTYGAEILNSLPDVRNNIFAASGAGAYAMHYVGLVPGSFFDHNFYASFDGAKRFDFALPSAALTSTDDLNVWKGFIGGEVGSQIGDPEFRNRTEPLNIDLDVSDTCPEMAAAPAMPDVRTDIRSERRPVDFVTMGAHENAEVITESGKKRFLELLGGLSAYPVTKAVLGNSGSDSLFHEFPAQLTSDIVDDPLFTPIDIEGIIVPGIPGSEGTVIFRPAFQVTLPIYGELLDPVFDRANEVGLLSADNNVFMVKRMHSIPFDACGFMSTQMTIPVEVVT